MGGGGGGDLLVEAHHGHQACLRHLGTLFGGLGGGEGLAVQGSEVGLGPQEAWHEEVEEGPQLQHVVLDGGPRQDEAVLRFHSLACLQSLGVIRGEGKAGAVSQGGKQMGEGRWDFVGGRQMGEGHMGVHRREGSRRRGEVCQEGGGLRGGVHWQCKGVNQGCLHDTHLKTAA